MLNCSELRPGQVVGYRDPTADPRGRWAEEVPGSQETNSRILDRVRGRAAEDRKLRYRAAQKNVSRSTGCVELEI